jgi:endonuclease/exonuclease/phosphatase family metal-dependent hydrolase
MIVTMKIVSWNLGAAFGRWRDDEELHERAWRWIVEADPDVALLQETRPPAWALDRWTVLNRPFELFASVILARPGTRLQELVLEPRSTLERFGAYLATGELGFGNDTVVVASVHTSAKLAPEWGHPGFDRSVIARETVGEPWWNDVAFAGYQKLVDRRPFLIGGDWNTSRYIDVDGNASPEGAEFFERASKAGWNEVSLDQAGREGKSWYGSGNPRPYQPDHVFADSVTAARIRAFEIDSAPAIDGLSDHAPLVFEAALS